MAASNRPSWISSDLYSYISSLLSKSIFAPSLALNAAMDEIFKDTPWWEFEYETILDTLSAMGFPIPSVHILGQMQCIAALRNGKSLIDKEWHLFEKSVLSLTGIPVLFFDKQNVPIEYVHHATSIMRTLGTSEFSEEVLHYIGCEAINDEILWYPIGEVDTEIVNALSKLSSVLGPNVKELMDLRETVKARFKEIVDKDIDKVTFDTSNVQDMMCLAIYRSLLVGRDLRMVETEELSKFMSIKDGHSMYTKDGVSESVPPMDSDSGYIDSENEVIYTDDSPIIESFYDAAKETMSDKVAEVLDYMEKIGSLPGAPIATGVPMGGQMLDTPGRIFKQVDSPETAQKPAEEAMADLIRTTVTKSPDVNNSPFDL
jgi:hypothetical protein